MAPKFTLTGKTVESLEKVFLTMQVHRRGTAVVGGKAGSSAPALPIHLWDESKTNTSICKGKDNLKAVKLISMSFFSYKLVVKFIYKNKVCKNILQMCEMLQELNITVLKSFMKINIYEFRRECRSQSYLS